VNQNVYNVLDNKALYKSFAIRFDPSFYLPV